MFNDFRWGGISVRGFIRALLPDVWMVIAIMIITYLAIGVLGSLTYSPEYEASTIVAVYPDNILSPTDTSADRMDTAAAVNGVLSSKAFQSGLENLLDDSKKRTISSSYLPNTNLLTITVRSPSAKDAYDTIGILINYYNSMAEYLTGGGVLETVVRPEIPLKPANSSKLLDYRLLLTLFMGFAMGAFLSFLYLIRKTYKTAGSVERAYKDVRFFRIPKAPAGRIGFAGRRKKMTALRQSAVRKTAEELRQMIWVLSGKTILITSGAKGERNSDFACELADAFESLGKSVLLVEADFEDTGLTKTIGKDGNLPDNGILDVLGEKCSLKDVSVRKNEKNILTAYSGLRNEQEDSHYTYTPEDVKRVMAEAKNLADFVLIDVGVWGGAGDGRIWNTESDFSLAVCAPEKAEFKAEDRMIEDLSNGQSDFAGIVLNGF